MLHVQQGRVHVAERPLRHLAGGEAGALDGGVDALGMGGEEVLAERRVGLGLPAGGGLARYLPGRVGADGPAVLPQPLT